MPPRIRSRYTFTLGFEDEGQEGIRQLSTREPYRYRDLADNIEHVVVEGDTLHTLAAVHYAGIPDAAELWWVIADFQPEPIHDPTIALTLGSTVVIPSRRTVLENVFDANRRRESGI